MYAHLYGLIRDRAERYPDAIAFGAQHGLTWKTLTSRQALDLVDRLANELATQGVQEGDRVVLWVPNHSRTPIYLFALWKLGAIPVPFDREMNPTAGARILESVEPRLVVTGYDERPAWAKGTNEEQGTIQPSSLVEWWDPGTRSPSTTPLSTQHSALSTWSPPAEDLAAIFFTSGTTGQPKGCMITHANLCSQVEALGDNIPLDATCRLASIVPLSHLFEFTCGLLYPLSQGAAIHYIPSRRAPDVLRVLNEQRITHMIAVPQLLTMMGGRLDEQLRAKLPRRVYRAMNAIAERLPLPARRKLFWLVHRKLGGQLQMMASGGAALPAETQRLWERLGVRIVQGYGASECSPCIAAGAADGTTPMGSVGKPIRGVQVRMSKEGELLVKGPNVMRGYWHDSEKTAEVLQDGWYATGDLATIDAQGNVRITGRAKDLIVLPSGMKVWPQDVEDVLRADPAVKDAAVIAVPAPGGGATLHAYLIPSGSPSPLSPQSSVLSPHADLGEIVARCNGLLAQHQRIATASWWPESDFPRTSTLKVRRHLLPPPEKAEAAEVVTVASALAADDPVGQAIAGVARVDAVRGDQTLAELALDSLALTELAVALEEKTGRSVGDGDLSLDMTVDQVRASMAGAAAPAARSTSQGEPLPESVSAEQPLWPYTWGRALRFLGSPFDLLYRLSVTRTVVLGREHLLDLPNAPVIFAGTHHSFADVPLVRFGIKKTPARRFFNRLVVSAAPVRRPGVQLARPGQAGQRRQRRPHLSPGGAHRP